MWLYTLNSLEQADNRIEELTNKNIGKLLKTTQIHLFKIKRKPRFLCEDVCTKHYRCMINKEKSMICRPQATKELSRNNAILSIFSLIPIVNDSARKGGGKVKYNSFSTTRTYGCITPVWLYYTCVMVFCPW